MGITEEPGEYASLSTLTALLVPVDTGIAGSCPEYSNWRKSDVRKSQCSIKEGA